MLKDGIYESVGFGIREVSVHGLDAEMEARNLLESIADSDILLWRWARHGTFLCLFPY